MLETKWSYNPPSENETTVEVTFTKGEITQTRTVNAVFNNDAYDAEATEVRVSEVALGVENKLTLGVLQIVDDA
tara:strand:- start:3573 stop:3794 length:222 start_codon:yes stop_codon:yes gene_type:complete